MDLCDAVSVGPVMTPDENVLPDLEYLNRDQLVVLSRVLIAMASSQDVDELLTRIHPILAEKLGPIGCALYEMADNHNGLHIIRGTGSYTDSLPNVIPSASELFQRILTGAVGRLSNTSNSDQLGLFEDDSPPIRYYAISVECEMVGAVALVGATDMHAHLTDIACRQVVALASRLYRLGHWNQLSPNVSELITSPAQQLGSKTSMLTVREKEVCDMLAEGLSGKEIASRLFISNATCKNHVQNILEKLNVHNRAAAVARLLSQ